MSAVTAQAAHARRLALLILYAHELGYEVTGGDWYRDPRATFPYGNQNSKHKVRLATDLNLFKNGKYLSLTSDHKLLGEFWETLGGMWGGRWDDGNHYESPP